MSKEIIIKINHKALVQLLRIGTITNDQFKFKEVFYSDGERIEQEVLNEQNLNLISGLVVD